MYDSPNLVLGFDFEKSSSSLDNSFIVSVYQHENQLLNTAHE